MTFSKMGCTFLLLFFCGLYAGAICWDAVNEEIKARRYFFNESSYNRHILPIQSNGSREVLVTVYLNLNKVIDVDYVQQVARFSVTMEFFWLDMRAVWNESLSKTTFILVPSSEIWTPQLTLRTCTNPAYCGSVNDIEGKVVRVSNQVRLYVTYHYGATCGNPEKCTRKCSL